MRRKTRVGRSSYRQIALGERPSLYSNKLHYKDNSKTAFPSTKTNAELPKESKILTKSTDIYPKQGFCGKMMITPEPDGRTTGEAVEEPRRIEASPNARTNQSAVARRPEERETSRIEESRMGVRSNGGIDVYAHFADIEVAWK